MNYRHLFHAGNFADVVKHIVLTRLLRALARKDKGFAYLETHAGPGRFDLRAPAAEKTGEYRDGIARLWREPLADIEDYLAIVRMHNRAGQLRYYPGSPHVARALLRPQDRMRLAEQSPGECEQLHAEFAGDRQVSVACADGYAALKGWLPPPERRGLVLIDPPYERSDEWDRLRTALVFSARRWPQGCYAVWYPLKASAPLARLKSKLVATGLRNMLLLELNVWPDDTPFRLNGCGMLLLNPPWQIDSELRALLPLLAQRLQQGPESSVSVDWLVPE
jgi:23S rRNA (adenine2030-N6)-methyltransferase